MTNAQKIFIETAYREYNNRQNMITPEKGSRGKDKYSKARKMAREKVKK